MPNWNRRRRALNGSTAAIFVALAFAACNRDGANRPGAVEVAPSQSTVAASEGPFEITHTEAEWRRLLTPEQYRITREKGDERAYTGKYWNYKRKGRYTCVGCGAELFDSDTKFDAGTGLPSFSEPVSDRCIMARPDDTADIERIEVLCRRCGAHLGQVFNDGPQPAGLRYSVNSAALQFTPTD